MAGVWLASVVCLLGRSYTVRARALNGAGWSSYSVASAPFTPQAPVVRTIIISGQRAMVKGREGVTASGVTSGLVGQTVQARVKLAGEVEYQDGSRRVVDAAGDFAWQRVTSKKVSVYFVTEGREVRSNRIILPVG